VNAFSHLELGEAFTLKLHSQFQALEHVHRFEQLQLLIEAQIG
jgi:hypothetical protein